MMQPENSDATARLVVSVCCSRSLWLRGLRRLRTPTRRSPISRWSCRGHSTPETLPSSSAGSRTTPRCARRLEVGLPPLVVTTNADEIETFEHRLAERIVTRAGHGAARCSLPAMEGQLKRCSPLARMRRPSRRSWTTVPGEFDVDINETYNKKHALATMPPNILLRAARSAERPRVPLRWTPPDSPRRAREHRRRRNSLRIRCRDCVPEPEHDDESNDDAAHAR